MRLIVSICIASLAAITASWAGLDISVASQSVTETNNAAAAYQAGARLIGSGSTGLSANWQATSIRNSSWNGQTFQEFMVNNGGNAFLSPGQNAQLVQIWNGSLPSLTSVPMIKEGTCNQPGAPCDAAAITLSQLDSLLKTSAYYDSTHRYVDLLGGKGGLYSANILDSYCGETQIQFAIPPSSVQWNISNTNISFDQNNGAKGDLMWMSLSGVQELFNMDAQVMMSSGMKETWFLTTGMAVQANVGLGQLTPFSIENMTFLDQLNGEYPSLYPFGLTYDRYLGGVSAADGIKTTEGELAINGVLSAGLLWRSYYLQLSAETDLAWKQVLQNSSTNGDPLIGLCYMASMYNQGPGITSVHQLLLPDSEGGQLSVILDNPNACQQLNTLLPNFGNYITALQSNATALENASKQAMTDPSVQIVDRWITWNDVVEFWFGLNGSPTMAGSAQAGGLLLHFNIPTATRQAIYDQLQQAFAKQSAHWPMQNGVPVISLRYDWLSNMRTVKGMIDRSVVASFPSWRQSTVTAFSSRPYSGDGFRIDNGYPFAVIQNATLSGDFAFDVVADDPFYTAGSSDPTQQDRGISKIQWSSDDLWSVWHDDGISIVQNKLPRLIGNDTGYLERVYHVQIPAALVQQLQSQGGAKIYIKVTDLCGNAIVITTAIAGVHVPKITSAQMFDKNGDGFADSLYFVGVDDSIPFSSFTSANFTWGSDSRNNATVTGKYGIVDTTLSKVNLDPTSGKLSLTYPQGSASYTIADMVGPVILSASLQQKMTSDALDTLVLSFNRRVSGIDSTTAVAYLQFFGHSSSLGVPQQIISFTGKLLTVVYPAGSINAYDPEQPSAPADSVRIVPGGVLIAAANSVTAATNNQKVQIVLNKGPLLLKDGGNHAWMDVDGDGTMDMAQVEFARTIDAYRLQSMKVSLIWKKGAKGVPTKMFYSGSQLTSNGDLLQIKFAPGDSITPNLTYFDNTNSDTAVRWGSLVVYQPNLTTGDTLATPVPMADRMGPVIVKANLVSASNPQAQPDYLDLTFSEPLDTKATKGSHLFRFRKDGTDQDLKHDSVFVWRSSGAAMRLVFSPQIVVHPSLGDSVKFLTQNIDGLAVDLAGNIANDANPLRPISGNPVLQIIPVAFTYFPTTNADKHLKSFDTLIAFDKTAISDTLGLDSIAGRLGLSGFYVKMTFNDTKDTSKVSLTSTQLDSIRNGFRLNLNVNIYDQIGNFVASLNRSVSCKDVEKAGANDLRLSGACDPTVLLPSREFYLFFPWNCSDNNGNTVGTGPYMVNAQVSTNQNTQAKLDPPAKIGVIRVKQP